MFWHDDKLILHLISTILERFLGATCLVFRRTNKPLKFYTEHGYLCSLVGHPWLLDSQGGLCIKKQVQTTTKWKLGKQYAEKSFQRCCQYRRRDPLEVWESGPVSLYSSKKEKCLIYHMKKSKQTNFHQSIADSWWLNMLPVSWLEVPFTECRHNSSYS